MGRPAHLERSNLSMREQSQQNTSLDWRDTNIGMLGSDLEKEIKKAAAEGEPQWRDVGKQPGLQVWRIEQFRVVPWPKSKYGRFHEGDSYVVLHTSKKAPMSLEGISPAAQTGHDALAWDIHFWIGSLSTADEYGTAAYKAQELDHLLDDAATQHRETQGNESREFCELFGGNVQVLKGGVETGFRKVKMDCSREGVVLLKVKGKGEKIVVRYKKPAAASLNSGDVFVLATPDRVFKWEGKGASSEEKLAAEAVARALQAERGGRATLTVIAEGSTTDELKSSDRQHTDFWDPLGGRTKLLGLVSSVAKVQGGDEDYGRKRGFPCLHRLSDGGWFSGGKLRFSKESLKPLSRLSGDDVYVLDTGAEVFIWVGDGASEQEKSNAFFFAQQYIQSARRLHFLPLTTVKQGKDRDAKVQGCSAAEVTCH